MKITVKNPYFPKITPKNRDWVFGDFVTNSNSNPFYLEI
jgi:hypothetical protein